MSMGHSVSHAENIFIKLNHSLFGSAPKWMKKGTDQNKTRKKYKHEIPLSDGHETMLALRHQKCWMRPIAKRKKKNKSNKSKFNVFWALPYTPQLAVIFEEANRTKTITFFIERFGPRQKRAHFYCGVKAQWKSMRINNNYSGMPLSLGKNLLNLKFQPKKARQNFNHIHMLWWCLLLCKLLCFDSMWKAWIKLDKVCDVWYWI